MTDKLGMSKSKKALARDMAECHTDLNAFAAIIAICEGGIFGARSYSAAEQIIRRCKREIQRSLRGHDKALAELLKAPAHDR